MKVKPKLVVLCTVLVLVWSMLGGTLTASADPGYHIVRAGETLYSIARLYGVSAMDIASANGLANPNYLRVGQVLHIPGRAPPPAPYAPPRYPYPSWPGSWGSPYWGYPPVAWYPWWPSQSPPPAPSQAPTCSPTRACIPTDGCDLSVASAICLDSTCSCSQNRETACLYHGGVRCWVRPNSTGGWTEVYTQMPPGTSGAQTSWSQTAPQPSPACCKYCCGAKPCGDTCIPRRYTCFQPPGCACWKPGCGP
jgi:LysM repeat protein